MTDPGCSPVPFPSEEAKSVQGYADEVHAAVQSINAWWKTNRPDGLDDRQVLDWERRCRHIRHASRRPPAVGVFGESQAGKSYLIGRFSGSQQELRIKDPEFERTGRISAGKPWTGDIDANGGFSFLKYVNPENRAESTSLICRFTEHPVDRPVMDDCFVARLLSHTDVIISLASGYLFEFRQDRDASELVKLLQPIMDRVREAPTQLDEHGWMNALYDAWEYLGRRFGERAHIRALREVGFDAFLRACLDRECRPSDPAWFELVGMLWDDPTKQGFHALYKRLIDLLGGIDFSPILEIPAAVLGRSQDDRTLPDVELLKLLFDDDPTTIVYYRAEGASSASEARLRRSEVAALVAELVLPVSGASSNDLSARADVLDFPGARPAQAFYDQDEKEPAAVRQATLSAYRRGKLTRLFTTMAEQREITVLCLCVPAESLEAAGAIRHALDEWLEVQRAAGEKHAGEPPLLLAVTKADNLIRETEAELKICQFGNLLERVHAQYSTGSGDRDWMNNWPPEQKSFGRVYWVHDKTNWSLAKHKYSPDHIQIVRNLYETSERVKQYVEDPQAKWEALVNEEDVELLAARIASMVHGSSKFLRLRNELDDLKMSIIEDLSDLRYVGDGDEEIRREARESARQDIKSFQDAFADHRVNALARFLKELSIDQHTLLGVLHRLDRERTRGDGHGAVVTPTCGEFLDLLDAEWSGIFGRRMTESATTRLLAIEPRRIKSLRKHWSRLLKQQWLRERLTGVAQPYFDAGPFDHRRSLAAAVAAALNAAIVDLGETIEDTPDPELPPTLSPADQPAWMWILRHWEQHAPAMYAGSVSDSGPIPAWNDELVAIIEHLKSVGTNHRVASIPG